MFHLFEVPELLCLICERIQRSDLARLLTISRLFFECAMPFVWRSLPESAAMILLGLLPNPGMYLNTNLKTTVVEAILDNIQPLDTQSVSRFNLYAPHIKQIIRRYQNKQSNVAWDRLFKLVSARPILPHLQVLRISIISPKSPSRWIVKQNFVPYLEAYLSPTLIVIDNVGGSDSYLQLEPKALTRLVSRIVRECPNLQSLKLQAANIRRFVEYDPDELANSLGQLRNLRSLKLGFAALDLKGLESLSNLPNLESLSLNEPPERLWFRMIPKIPNVSFPEGSFPALRHLGLCIRFKWDRMCDIWSITVLVQHLESVSLHIFGETSVRSAEFRHLLNTISESSPFVRRIRIDCTCFRDSDLGMLSTGVVDDLARLPLEHLQLSGKGWTGRNYCGSEVFARAFPRMKSLQVRGYEFSFEDLAMMAKYMPSLQYLSIPVKTNENWPEKSKLPGLEVVPSPSRLDFHFMSSGSAPDICMGGTEALYKEVEAIAAGLHALWPSGVTCVTYQRPVKGSAVTWVDPVNVELKQLRKVDSPFEIPEIISLVCERMPRSHLGRLLIISRLFFECAVPFVWRSLPESAAMILLGLLPNSSAYLITSLRATVVEAILDNLQPLDMQLLLRFNLYAPHVKRIVRRYQNKQSNIAWNRLLKLVGARPILPNLEVLRISINLARGIPEWNITQNFVQYLEAFWSPTLIEIDNVGHLDSYLELKPQTLTHLVSRIAHECPHPQSLKLRVASTRRPMVYDSEDLAGSLRQLHNLRSLRLGFAGLDPKVLLSLGSLPNLESLSFNDAPEIVWYDIITQIPIDFFPQDSFPALRHLGVCIHSEWDRIREIWDITTLVQRLESISVHILWGVGPKDVCDLVRAISIASPLVTGIRIDCTRSHRENLGLISGKIVDALAELPLERLWLSGRGWTDSDYCGGEAFARAFPNMKSLNIRGYDFSFDTLAMMAKYMPMLQHLSIPVITGVNLGWPKKDELVEIELVPSPSPLKHHFVNCASVSLASSGIVEDVAAGLHSLWPSGVTCATYQRSDKGSKRSWVGLVNAELKRLRELEAPEDIQTEVTSWRMPPWLEPAEPM